MLTMRFRRADVFGTFIVFHIAFRFGQFSCFRLSFFISFACRFLPLLGFGRFSWVPGPSGFRLG